MGWPGLGQADSGLSTRSSARAIWPGPAKGTPGPGPPGALGPWLGGPGRRVSPGAAPAAGGPPSPAPPQWPTGFPAPGPRKEHQGSFTGRAQSARLVVPLAGCVASGGFASPSLGDFIQIVGTETPPSWAALRITVHKKWEWGQGP